jgi:uncharacterized protein (DUF697 family)/predicted GTPase
MLEKLKHLFSRGHSDEEFHRRLEQLRIQAPVPVIWLLGKTQSGKTSIIKYLTGAEDAEIGQGFQSCTRFSRIYHFPTEEAPLVTFLDTRGLEEPGYDATKDLEEFHRQAHVLLVTVKALDHATEKLVEQVRNLRWQQPDRPVVLALTCLHEAYPQEQHPLPEEVFNNPNWDKDEDLLHRSSDLLQTLRTQKKVFMGLFDYLVPLDLTPPMEGFNNANYGGTHLKDALVHSLPGAYRQTLLHLGEATRALQDMFARRALPHILAFSSMAATAGAIPIPWIDLLIIPGIQTRMIYHLAKLYGQPLTGKRFLELAGTLGMGMLVRQATRELVKFIPFVGSVAGAALAGSSTFALGKAFCFYYSAVHKGHVPKSEDLKQYYQEQLTQAEKLWKQK